MCLFEEAAMVLIAVFIPAHQMCVFGGRLLYQLWRPGLARSFGTGMGVGDGSEKHPSDPNLSALPFWGHQAEPALGLSLLSGCCWGLG